MGTNVQLSDVRIVKHAGGAPQPIDDQNLDRVAGGGTMYSVTFPGGCTHTFTHPSNSITETELFNIAVTDHERTCT